MIKKTYREVELPKRCTRAVLRKMKSKLIDDISRGRYELTYTCILIGNIIPDEDSYIHWGVFLEKLEFYNIFGSLSSFRHHHLPKWFTDKFPADRPNINRLNFIKDILKECYNE